MNTIVIIILAACVALGYYAWRQQQRALLGLQTLKNSGVEVAFWLRSRPLLAVDKDKGKLYLIAGNQPQSPMRLDMLSVKQLSFIESPPVSNNNTDARGADTIVIEMNDGNSHRVGDLPDGESGAKNAKALFERHKVLNDKLTYQPR